MPPKLTQAQKLLLLDKNGSAAVFFELQDLKDAINNVVEAVNASKTTEITVSNPEDMKTSLVPLQANFDDLAHRIDVVAEAIRETEASDVDLSGVERLLQTIATKEPPDMTSLKKISAILGDILVAIKESPKMEDIHISLDIV